jgi:hypothetical protein
MEIGDVKAEARAEVEAATEPGVKVGVRYDRFGIFWIDFFRWDTSFVLFHGNTFWDVPEAELADMSAVPLKKPFTATIPPGLIGLAIALMIFIAVKVIGRKKAADEAAATAGAPPGEAAPTAGAPPSEAP